MENITQQDWKERLSKDENAVVLDVRTASECAEGMQDNAIQLDILDAATFSAGIDALDKDKTYYVYCRSGGRSGSACQMMAAKGFKTFNLIGGMMAWQD